MQVFACNNLYFDRAGKLPVIGVEKTVQPYAEWICIGDGYLNMTNFFKIFAHLRRRFHREPFAMMIYDTQYLQCSASVYTYQD